MNWYTLPTHHVIVYTTRSTQGVGDGICRIKMLVVQWLCESYVHLTLLNGPFFLWIAIPDTISSNGNIQYNFDHTIATHPWVVIGVIPCFLKGTKTIRKSKPYTVGSMQAQRNNLHMTGPGLEWNWADWFLHQSYPLWPLGVGIWHNQSWLIKSLITNIQCVNWQ